MKLTEILSTEKPANQLLNLNRLLASLTRSSRHSDCLNLFARSRSKLTPDHCTLSTALSAAARGRSTAFGAQLHALAVRTGLSAFRHVSNSLLFVYARAEDVDSAGRVFDQIGSPDVYSWTTFLSACAKLGHLGYAYKLFEELPERELPLWNAIITGFSDNGQEEMVFRMFSEMHRLGVAPDQYSYASVLSSCDSETVDIGKQVHCLVIKTGFLSRVSVINSLLTLYFDYGNPSEAFKIFREVKVRDEITFNAMIDGLVRLNRGEEALQVFREMQEACLRPTELTLVSLMSSESLAPLVGQLHSLAVKMGLQRSTLVSNAVISTYSSYGDLHSVKTIFEELDEKDLVSWNTIMSCYAKWNLSGPAISTFSQMRRLGVVPDGYTFGSLLANSGSVGLVEMVQGLLWKTGLIRKVEVCNSLVSSYSRLGSVNRAYETFEQMPCRNLITWNALISGLHLNGFLIEGLEIFARLLIFGPSPNLYTLTIALTICAEICSLKHGKQIHAYVIRQNFFVNSSLGNAIIGMYSKCGDFNLARRVFAGMVERDTVSWNSMISDLARHGKGKEALELFGSMRNEISCKADEATFTAVISACSRAGLLIEGIEVFNSMVNDYRIVPREEHVSCLLDLIGRAGWLNEAEIVIRSNRLKGRSGLLWTLFGACVSQGNVRLGRIIAKLLLDGDEDESSVYVMLSNVYAANGLWKEAADVREVLKRNRVVKKPGISRVGS